MKFREDKVEASRIAIEQGEDIHNAIKGTLKTIATEKDIPETEVKTNDEIKEEQEKLK